MSNVPSINLSKPGQGLNRLSSSSQEGLNPSTPLNRLNLAARPAQRLSSAVPPLTTQRFSRVRSLTRRLALSTLALAAFSLLVGGLANSFNGAQAEEYSLDDFAIQAIGDSVSISDSNSAPCIAYDAANDSLPISAQNGAISNNCAGIHVSTDSADGYTLSIAGPSSGNLVGSSNSSNIITPTSGTITSPAVFTTGSTSTWGFAVPRCQLKGTTATGCTDPNTGNPQAIGSIPNGFDANYQLLNSVNTTNTGRYARVPTAPVEISTTSTANTVSDVYNVYFATRIAPNAATGSYTGEIIFSVVANKAPFQDIQTITAANCPTIRTAVRDARDGHTYWVRKIDNTNGLGDGLGVGQAMCWMETNLAYAGDGDNTYGDVIPTSPTNDAVAITGLLNVTNATTIANSSLPCYTDYNRACVYTGLMNANPTSGTDDPTLAPDGAIGADNAAPDPRAQYGYLYNWCAAMGVQVQACQGNAAIQPSQSANPGTNNPGGTPAPANGTNIYNICPAGWRLPTSAATTGEYTLLNNAINGGAPSDPSGFFTNGLYMYSGYWGGDSFGGQGFEGYYWSSTVANTTLANSFYVSETINALTEVTSKSDGFAVRCVSAGPDTIETGDDIQAVTANNCPVNRTRVRDARDGHTYWIRKIPGTKSLGGSGDLCWMETNLAYAGNTTAEINDPAINKYGDMMTLTSTTGTGTNIAAKLYYIPLNAKPTSGTDDPVTTTDGAAGAGNTVSDPRAQYGYLYNWCAAMGGQSDACQSATAAQPNQSANPGNGTIYNVCPAGWRLPTGETTTGEFTLLNNTINSGSGTSLSGLLTNGLYMYDGYLDTSAIFRDQGISGFLLSSTVHDNQTARNIYFGRATVDPTNRGTKSVGVGVRCVAG